MFRWRFNFTIALLLSAAFHLALLSATPVLWRGSAHTAPHQAAPPEITVALQDPDLTPPPTPPEFEMGMDKAKGYGSNEAKGDEPLKAREAEEDQALLSREPGTSGRLMDVQASDRTLPGENGAGGQQGAAAQVIVSAPPVPDQKSTEATATITPPIPPSIQLPKSADQQIEPTIAAAAEPTVDLPKVEPQLPSPPTPPARQQVAAALSAPTPPVEARPQTGDGRAPGVDLRQADPAQKSDSESDPFAKIGSAVFHDGRLEIRDGRKVKTTRPRILLAGQFDLMSMGTASVVLKIDISPTGKVTAVDIAHSSGSNNVDQPCRVAIYEWWFEPARDKRGNPVADSITFTIKFE